ncbi:MAG: type II toxin-antitoxin system prevent-host-death family antitoxin [Verrucomicrobiae bacterium]
MQGAPVNIHEAKTHFSKLIERVQEGEVIVVAKAGKAVARLVPTLPAGGRRVSGRASKSRTPHFLIR